MMTRRPSTQSARARLNGHKLVWCFTCPTMKEFELAIRGLKEESQNILLMEYIRVYIAMVITD